MADTGSISSAGQGGGDVQPPNRNPSRRRRSDTESVSSAGEGDGDVQPPPSRRRRRSLGGASVASFAASVQSLATVTATMTGRLAQLAVRGITTKAEVSAHIGSHPMDDGFRSFLSMTHGQQLEKKGQNEWKIKHNRNTILGYTKHAIDCANEIDAHRKHRDILLSELKEKNAELLKVNNILYHMEMMKSDGDDKVAKALNENSVLELQDYLLLVMTPGGCLESRPWGKPEISVTMVKGFLSIELPKDIMEKSYEDIYAALMVAWNLGYYENPEFILHYTQMKNTDNGFAQRNPSPVPVCPDDRIVDRDMRVRACDAFFMEVPDEWFHNGPPTSIVGSALQPVIEEVLVNIETHVLEEELARRRAAVENGTG